MDTLAEMVEIMRTGAERPFVIDSRTGEQTSYTTLHTQACAVRAMFQERGLKRGDHILFVVENNASMPAVYFGALYAGCVAVPVNPALGGDFCEYVAKNSGVRLAVISSGLDSLLKGAPELDSLSIDDLVAGARTRPSGEPESWSEAFANTEAEEPALIIYTSGTASVPKGVVHSIKSLVANGLKFVELMELGPNNRFYNLLPMAYLGGYYNLMLIPFLCGGSVVVGRAFGAKEVLSFWKPVVKHEVNTLWLVPTIMAMLMELDRGNLGRAYCPKSIVKCFVGTAPLPDGLRSGFQERYGIKLYENYGLSETLFLTANAPSHSNPAGVGRLVEGVELSVLDKNGEHLEDGQPGEIVVKTNDLMVGYLGDPDPGTGLQTGDWFHTGDFGFLDSEGRLHISGRLKDLIIKGGINVSPAPIESLLSEHTAVRECVVVGVPHRIMGEEIAAVVRLNEEANLELVEMELRALAAERLAPIHRPVYYLEIPEIPHTATGKAQKAKVRSWAADEMAGEPDNSSHPMLRRLKANMTPPNFFQPSHAVGSSIEATSVRLNNQVYELKASGVDVTVLSLGEAFFEIPLLSFDGLPKPDIFHYSHSRGIPRLRAKLAHYFLQEYDVGFDPESQILVTAGSKIAVHMALMTILDPGDEVIIPDPAWVSYPEQVKLCYGTPVQIPYEKTVFDYEDYITNRTKVIIINNPHNPTGRVLTLEEISYLVRLAEKYGLFVLADEAYSDFLLEDEKFISVGNIDKELSHTIICNSMSKNYGMSGWRVGYAISNPAMINQILKLNQHLVTCPPTILAHYLVNYFDSILKVTKPQIMDVVQKRQRMGDYMESIGLKSLDGSATFYFFVSIAESSLGSEEFSVRLLKEHHIGVVPGLGYGPSCDKFVRVSIGTEPEERVKAALRTMKELIDRT